MTSLALSFTFVLLDVSGAVFDEVDSDGDDRSCFCCLEVNGTSGGKFAANKTDCVGVDCCCGRGDGDATTCAVVLGVDCGEKVTIGEAVDAEGTWRVVTALIEIRSTETGRSKLDGEVASDVDCCGCCSCCCCC